MKKHELIVVKERVRKYFELSKLEYEAKGDKLNKGVWGMPRLPEAMKDVISCEKLRGLAHTI